MKNYLVFFVLLILAFNSEPVLAQNNNDSQEVEPGIEARKVADNITVLMPKGGRMHKTNDITYIQEGTDEYAARNFASVENRLDRLEKDNGEFREEIKNIKSRLSSSEKNAPDVNK